MNNLLQPVYIPNQQQNDDELNQFLAQLQASGKANDLFNPQIGYTNEQLREGITNGLNYGNKDIANYIDRNNIRKPETEEDIELARLGKFNTPEIKGSLSQEINPQPQQKSGFFAGYRDNYDNGFAPSNLQKGNKTWGYRLGEGLGTVGRFIDSPLGRGILAAGLNSALGYDNSALEGLTAASGRQNAVTADKLYRNELKKYGYTDDELASVRGTIDADMFKNLSNNAYRSQKLTQDQAMKQLNAIRQLHSAGQIDNNTASMAIAKILQNTDMGDMGGFNFQDSNQTRNTTSQIDYRNQKLEQDKIKLQQNQQKIAILQQKVALGMASQAQIAELRALNIENKELENSILQNYLNDNGGGNNPTPTRAVGEKAQPKSNKLVLVGVRDK